MPVRDNTNFSDTQPIEANLLGACANGIAAMRLIGRASLKVGKEFIEFGTSALEQGVHTIVLDFSECLSLDSTILGLIGKLALMGIKTTQIIGVNPSKEVRSQIDGIGVGKLISFQSCDSEQADWKCICQVVRGSFDSAKISKIVLDAHQVLMDIDQKNVPRFKSVVELLAKENEKN